MEAGSQRTPQHRRNPYSHVAVPYLEVGRPEEPLRNKAANLPRAHKTIRWRLPLENVAFVFISRTCTKTSWALCLREMTQGKTVHLCHPLQTAVTPHWSLYMHSMSFCQRGSYHINIGPRQMSAFSTLPCPCRPGSVIKFQSLLPSTLTGDRGQGRSAGAPKKGLQHHSRTRKQHHRTTTAQHHRITINHHTTRPQCHPPHPKNHNGTIQGRIE